MSGLIGHTMYGILARHEARARGLPIAGLLARHDATYLCGAYLGCDIQTMPEAVCVDTGREVGFGTVPVERSPITAGAVRPGSLTFDGREYRPRALHDRFYGRAHLIFGWTAAERQHAVPWDHLADYVAATIGDAIDFLGAGGRSIAYLFGWLVHIVGDSLIKSQHPGLRLHLVDGTYTPTNRPIQDLVTFHEVGRAELGLDWERTLGALAATPVEPAQLHAMRVARPRGALAAIFPNAWAPGDEALARCVLAENRRYLAPYAERLLDEYRLTDGPDGPMCDATLSRLAGGLTYRQMVAAAEQAHFRDALDFIAHETVDLFEQVLDREPRVAGLDATSHPAAR
ncbi:MAG: hypothetical protein ACKOFT_06675 [Actinomycetota bacterium]